MLDFKTGGRCRDYGVGWYEKEREREGRCDWNNDKNLIWFVLEGIPRKVNEKEDGPQGKSVYLSTDKRTEESSVCLSPEETGFIYCRRRKK